jgi:hypothetical protein
LDARLTTMLCKRISDVKYKDVKTGSILAEFSKDGYGSKSALLQMMMMMVMMMMMTTMTMTMTTTMITYRNNSNFSLI